MEFVFSAARWVVGKALAPVADGLLEAWAASKNLGAETDAITTELQYAQAMLNNTRGRDIDNPALNDLLLKLRLLAYDADDVLDELDYYRIQDELDGTYHAAKAHAGGCADDLFLNARHTARYVTNKLKVRQRRQKPKLKFDRVNMSTKMTDIVEKLKPICTKVSTILNLELLGSKGISTAIMERPTTSEEITEPILYGRETEKQTVLNSITHAECFANDLTVLPIVGPGGIGKTTFTQHVYEEVKGHFQVTIWICVSFDFNANRLLQEAVQKMPEVKDEKKNCSIQELIEQRLKGKRFLLVLDDIWKCHDDEWAKLLAPFRKGGGKGNMVIVTTRMSDSAKIVKVGSSQIQLDRLGAEDFRKFFDACVSTKDEKWSDHPELHDTGEQIVKKLKCNPLAAKTVGRLLRKQLNDKHWRRVLESKEWEFQTNENDIMPALKISYDYLPLNLKQCFSYCALFPEDYEFDSKELIHFWIGLHVLHLGDQSRRIEDVGKSYLIDLVNYGFFKRNEKDNGRHYYVIHDLLHELAVKVSRYDCLSIPISKVRYIQIPASVRHLSITVDNKDVEDRITFEDRAKDLGALDKTLQIENLRTLMIFGENVGSFSKTFGNLFKKARALRTIFLAGPSYIMEDMLQNFSKLVHLRYLRIKKSQYFLETTLSGSISRLYHLKILDIEDSIPSRNLSNLVNMQYFLVNDNSLHSDISNVGNLKLLQELWRFNAKKENNGFELNQLAQLLELEVLGIYNLEKVEAKEAVALKLVQKNHLQELILEWDINRSEKDHIREKNTLENLIPHSNLYRLSITGHGGDTCPSWLGVNLSVKMLEFLHLSDVPWKIFPPLGKLWFVDEHGEECLSYIPEQRFTNLKTLELVRISKLTKWVGNGHSDLFSHLKVLIIKDCPELMELPFSHHAGHEQEEETNMTWFPKLEKLEITDCPKLSSLPCIPWSSSTTCIANIARAGSGIERLSFEKNSSTGHTLKIKGKDALASGFWRVLAFDNLSKLELLEVARCPPMSLVHLGKLSSLRDLRIYDMGDAFCSAEGDDHVGYQFPVESITCRQYGGSWQRLTNMLSYFPKLNRFNVGNCEKLTGLGVVGLQKMTEALPGPLSISVNEVEETRIIGQHGQQQQQDERGEGEIAAAPTSEGLLLLPPQLQELDLRIWDCQNLVLCPGFLDDDKHPVRTGGGGGGLQGLRSLRFLAIGACPRFLSSYSSSSSPPCFPFPSSLEDLCLERVEGMGTLLPLSNLTSLTYLYINYCGDLRGEGLRPLLAQGRLTELEVFGTPNFFAGSEPSLPRAQESPSSSSKLKELWTDDVTGVLAAPISALLSSSLTKLSFTGSEEVERFTKGQEEALQLFTSLEKIGFWDYDKLQCLPAGLHKLPNLKRLHIDSCAAIRSLPKDVLPGSLQELVIEDCPAIRSLPKDCLPGSLQKLVIRSCPAIRSLPKVDDLPSSLRELDVRYSKSEDLRRHCRKLIGTIPIVRA